VFSHRNALLSTQEKHRKRCLRYLLALWINVCLGELLPHPDPSGVSPSRSCHLGGIGTASTFTCSSCNHLVLDLVSSAGLCQGLWISSNTEPYRSDALCYSYCPFLLHQFCSGFCVSRCCEGSFTSGWTGSVIQMLASWWSVSSPYCCISVSPIETGVSALFSLVPSDWYRMASPGLSHFRVLRPFRLVSKSKFPYSSDRVWVW